MVRLHLLLPEIATRRDLDDPATITAVADAVGDRSTLELLHALARADAAATGPAAWSAWKGRLIADLVARVERVLDTGVGRRNRSADAVCRPVRPDQLPVVRVDADRVEVVAAGPARAARRGRRLPGPAPAGGGRGRHRQTDGGVARLACAVQPRFGGEPDRAALGADLRRAVRGELDVAQAGWQRASESAVRRTRVPADRRAAGGAGSRRPTR